MFMTKPRVILDKTFDIGSVNVGDKLQLKARLEVVSERLQMEDDGNESRYLELKITELEPITNQDKRIT